MGAKIVWWLLITSVQCIYDDNHNIIAYTILLNMRDTDSNKSSDFLLNPVCMMLFNIIIVLLCKYLCVVQMK